MLVGSHYRRPSRGRVGARCALAAALLTVIVAPASVGVAGQALADDSQVTVDAPAGGSVTVEKTANLINEVIHVSWEGFKPSVNPGTDSDLFSPTLTRFAVRVYQCRTREPAAPGECYGSQIYEYPGRDDMTPNEFLGHPDGPFNYLQRSTAPDGTGAVDIEVMTKRESVTLGCNETTPCSIVVVPNYGDESRQDVKFPDLPACANIFSSDAECQIVSGNNIAGNNIDAEWSWKNRAVIPISFAPSAEACGLQDAEAAVLGSPKAERAMTSWQAATCTSDTPVNFDYTAQGEDPARNAFLNNLTDIALTDRPVDPAALGADSRKFRYAPVTTSALVVAFRVDDPATGLPIATMRLNPRLIVKLITESYGYGSWSTDDVDWGNPANRGNPITIFDDPEFLELNPGINWPTGINNQCATPLLLADVSDLTYELTKYLATDPQAVAFMAGEEDEWGMHLNATFADMTPYPISSYELRDPDDVMTHMFQPVQGLAAVARKLVGNTFAGTTAVIMPDGRPEKCGPGSAGYQPPGGRAFVAIIDGGNAGAYRFPTAAILNSAGEYVEPTPDAMAAAVDEMTTNDDGVTRTPNFESTDPDMYPLTLIDYAMVPTAGVDPAKAAAIGRILDYAAGPGQVTGRLYGGLPAGFLPLSAELVAQTAAAAAAVRAQSDAPPTPTPTPPTPSTPPTTGGDTVIPPVVPPGAGPIPTPAPEVPVAAATTGALPTTAAPVGAFRPIAANTPQWLGVILPVILFAGLAAAGLGALGSYLFAHGGISLPRRPRRAAGRRR